MSSRELPEFERLPRPHLPDARASAAYAPRRGFNKLLVFGIPVFAVLAFYAALVVVTALDDVFFPGNEFRTGVFAKIPGVESGKDPEVASPEERLNILVLGLDLRRDEPDDQPARTDTVMIMTIDPYAKTAGALSIPRDMWVEIPDGYGGFTRNRINVAYELGEYSYQGYPGGGGGLIKDTIKHNFDIHIDNYVVLNFNNFIDLVDELGGIEVDVPEDVYDPQYHDCNTCPYYEVYFPAGPQHMNGEEALAYSRIRYGDNDFKRIERQQIIVRAIAKKASSISSIVSNPVGLYRQFRNSIKTDISEFLLPGRARLLQQVDLDSVPMVAITPPLVYECPVSVCGGAAGLLWDEDKVQELVKQVFEPQERSNPLITQRAKISVKNGTVTPALAEDFALFLSGQGVASTQISVDEYFNGVLSDETAIYDLSGMSESAQQLADWLRIPYTRIYAASHPDTGDFYDERLTTDVVVVLGADATVPDSSGGIANQSQDTTTAGG